MRRRLATVQPAPEPTETQMAEALMQSRAWHFVQMYLVERRDLLARTPHSILGLSAEEKLGALAEVQRLLDGPRVYLGECLRREREATQAGREAASMPVNVPTDWWMNPAAALGE